MRRVGKTITGPIGCCIAEIAIANDALLFHRDRDVQAIAAGRPLRKRWIAFWTPASQVIDLVERSGREEGAECNPRDGRN